MSVINLRQARKSRERAQSRAKADENAAKFGLSKAEKTLVEARARKEGRALDGHRLEEGETRAGRSDE